jgi:phosphoribosyl 1,2-cyclic phosphate phosphodiesterase
MRLTLIGTGDAVGTPKVGCSCTQCTHAKTSGATRLRTSILKQNDGRNILIDSSPDLRQQLLLYGSPAIDAVIWTGPTGTMITSSVLGNFMVAYTKCCKM